MMKALLLLIMLAVSGLAWGLGKCDPKFKRECELLRESLERTKEVWPRQCGHLVSPVTKRSLPGSKWDQRKCYSHLLQEDLKRAREDFTTAQTSKLHRDGQKYREGETQKFLAAAQENSQGKQGLYESHKCLEEKGREIISKARRLKASWGRLDKSLDFLYSSLAFGVRIQEDRAKTPSPLLSQFLTHLKKIERNLQRDGVDFFRSEKNDPTTWYTLDSFFRFVFPKDVNAQAS